MVVTIGEEMIKINGVFYSIQGEGIYQGLPMVFVRLQGCNLLSNGGCIWCDTGEAQDGNLGDLMEIGQVADLVADYRTGYKSWVCITGGEPLFQLESCHELVMKLKDYGYRVTIETNGSIGRPYWWTLVDSWSADMKCPSSGVCGISHFNDWFRTRPEDQVKFVVGDREDLDFARGLINTKTPYSPVVLVSPVISSLHGTEFLESPVYWDREWLQEVVEFCKEMRVRYSLQIHKLVGMK